MQNKQQEAKGPNPSHEQHYSTDKDNPSSFNRLKTNISVKFSRPCLHYFLFKNSTRFLILKLNLHLEKYLCKYYTPSPRASSYRRIS